MKMDSFSEDALYALDMVLNGFDGGMVIDQKGRIVVYTDKYAEVAGVPKDDVLGKFILDVFPKSRMMEVINTGKPIYIDVWETGPETVFVSRYPIRSDGQIIGVVSVCVFRYMNEAQKFAECIRKMGRELAYYKSQVRKLSGAKYTFESIIGNSRSIKSAIENARTFARTRVPVIITGETGTGKELFAHAIHQIGTRRDQPFVRINCASIPAELVESELFGYEDGAFSGARKGGKAGKFEIANGGTIFLDEVNELPYRTQAKLLRVLQEGEIDRVGGTKLNSVDVRVISATNANLSKLIAEKLFREDLYYRINTFEVKVPPLRERTEDIPLLCEYFINSCQFELGVSIERIDDQVLQFFKHYDWPGNVRELRNVLLRSSLIAGSGIIRMKHLPLEYVTTPESTEALEENKLEPVVQNFEKAHILKVLESVGGNRIEAARVLGINRTQLYRKINKYQLV